VPKRLFLCDVVGAGTRANPYRAAARAFHARATPVNVVPLLPGGGDGRPLFGHCLVLVSAAAGRLGTIAADPKCDLIPAALMDDLIDGLTLQQRTNILNALAKRGHPAGLLTALPAGARFRHFVRALARRYKDDADEDSLAVGEVS
jgi:hypothetical protein